MSDEVELLLRGPKAHAVAKRALEEMERLGVWPTAQNYELWINYLANPASELAREIERMIRAGEPFTDHVSDELAAIFLPKAKLNDQIRDAGDQLSKELANVTKVIRSAQASSDAYGATLASATKVLVEDQDLKTLKATIGTLAQATRRVQRENNTLEKRLAESSAEVGRLREHLEQVRRDATTDGLTNLANRKAFDEELERACAEAEAEGAPLSVAVIDIDHFKSFNDTWGHQTGDQVIRYVASVIGRLGAPPRFAARHGGEEFAMLFPAETEDKAVQVLEEIRHEVASRMLKRRSTNEDLGMITVSAGLAQRRSGEPGLSVMERADAALYASKRGGRNRVTSAERTADAA